MTLSAHAHNELTESASQLCIKKRLTFPFALIKGACDDHVKPLSTGTLDNFANNDLAPEDSVFEDLRLYPWGRSCRVLGRQARAPVRSRNSASPTRSAHLILQDVHVPRAVR